MLEIAKLRNVIFRVLNMQFSRAPVVGPAAPSLIAPTAWRPLAAHSPCVVRELLAWAMSKVRECRPSDIEQDWSFMVLYNRH